MGLITEKDLQPQTNMAKTPFSNDADRSIDSQEMNVQTQRFNVDQQMAHFRVLNGEPRK
jgi:hypothetical protein